MPNCNHHDNDNDNNAVESLRLNTGRVVTIFTQSGGLSGSGFTGLLVGANHEFVKLITNLPSAPPNPFGVRDIRGVNFFGNDFDSRRRCSMFGTVVVIPVNKIVSYVFNEI